MKDSRAAATPVFHVMLGETGWTVRDDAGVTTSYSSRREALREAERQAESRDAARVVVHYADTSVERQLLFHGEPRATRTWREDGPQAVGSRSTE